MANRVLRMTNDNVEDAKNAMTFLQRATLQGTEVPAFVRCLQFLQDATQAQEPEDQMDVVRDGADDEDEDEDAAAIKEYQRAREYEEKKAHSQRDAEKKLALYKKMQKGG